MRRPVARLLAMLLGVVLVLSAPAGVRAQAPSAGARPGRFAGDGIVVGLEYVTLDSLPMVRSMADAFATTGMTGMKHYAEAVRWGEMQAGPNLPIDFTKLDWFVGEYQQRGFTELTVTLMSQCRWGSRHVPWIGKSTNASPKPEFLAEYERWIGAVVERYDADGKDDLPGLRWPVRTIEIGSEFSSYQPEAVQDYLTTLAAAHRAAHRAFPDVRVGHAAFLITPVNLDVADPTEYERAWAARKHPDPHHGLADQRAILDHPECFDFVNLHNLGSPYEIESLMRWVRYETGRRRYTKPVVISDTLPTSYIGWGSATQPKGANRGAIVAPAMEADRERLAAFFTKLLRKDAATLAWTRGFVAADHVQRTIIAAEQGIALLNLSFTTDLPFLTLPVLQAGAGISAWGGAVETNLLTARVQQTYPLFHAIGQLMGHLSGIERVERIHLADPHARVYRLQRADRSIWVAWFDPGRALLPEDGQPSITVEIPAGVGSVVVEPVITGLGQTTPHRRSQTGQKGMIPLTLTHTPVYVLPE